MDTLFQDVRYAVRAFAKAPGFTLVALVTMAIAIGANATVFSFVNALLLRPPAGVKDPSKLVSVYTSDFSSTRYGTSSYPDFESISSTAGAFSQLAASAEQPATLLRVNDETERVRTLSVSAGYFDVLGIQPLAGRLIGASEAAGAPPSVVIGERLWRRALGADPAVVGTAVGINGVPHTVLGIVPAGFTGLDLGAAFDIWTPLAPRRDASARQSRSLSIVGRLAPDANLVQAQAQLDAISAQLAAAFPDSNMGTLAAPDRPRPIIVVRHTRMHPAFRAEVGMIAAVLTAAVALVLLMACANVAGLLLSRATARGREFAVRLALGASRGRLFRQTLTESVILGAGGGALGLLVALWTADALPSFFPAEQARLLDAGVDARVIAFTTAVAVLSGLVFGVAPAVQGLRQARTSVLRADGNRAGAARGSVLARKVLVVGQVAIASVLLVSAVLLTRSLSNAVDADLGFSTKRAVVSSIDMPRTITAETARPYLDSLLENLRALPGVEQAAVAQFVPVAGTFRRGFTMEGYVPRDGEDTELHINTVSREFFETMGIAPAAGRVFSEADRSGPLVAVVNHAFADRYYAGNAVGRRIVDSGDRKLEIVGVVRADRRLDLQDPSLPVVFYLLDQQFTRRLMVVARTAGDPASMADIVRRTIVPSNRDVAVFRTVTLEAHLEEALAGNRLTVTLVTVCGALALALALVGVYGIVAYAVVRRTREIGVRVALGATPWQVLRLLLTENGSIVALGLLIGLGAAMAATRLLGSLLYAISPTDAVTYGAVLATVGLVAAAACVVPASRALRVDPVAALRQD
ncbi:MAG TPA: ABC transporter permease [Vicinamibacterales bacterium]|nr:ABC transporter permease [Vicinamibacterales bacterium]